MGLAVVSGGRSRFAGGLGGGSGLCAALVVGLLQITVYSFLSASRVVVGLFCFAVFVDGPFALAQQIKNHAEIEMAPNLRPFLRRFGHALQRFAERIRRGLIILL